MQNIWYLPIFVLQISLINRYGGGTSVLGNQRSSSLFGGGGRRAFAIGAGAGFLGMVWLL